MIGTSLNSNPGLAILTVAAGFFFGRAYFATLKRSVALLATGRNWAGPIALTLARIAAAGGVFFLAAKLGAVPLLTALLGFLLARAVAVRTARRAA